MEIVLAIVLGLAVNEFTDVSPWAARKLVAWSARHRYGSTARGDIRTEELAAVINDRPGKLFKLGTAIGFVVAAMASRLRRRLYGDDQPADEASDGLGRLPLEPEPTPAVSRFLFPTERFRGEWRRHWIHLGKSLGVIVLYAVLGVWAALLRIKPQYAGWVAAAVVTLAVLAAGFSVAGWFMARFVITNKRLMSNQGVLFKRVATMPLQRVTDLRYTQSPLGRVLNYGTFVLESASRRNAMRKIVHLPHPNELYLRLVEEMYEPEAVDARLADYDSEEDGDGLGGELAPDRRVHDLQREIVQRINGLAADLSNLATAMDEARKASEDADHIDTESALSPRRTEATVKTDGSSAQVAS